MIPKRKGAIEGKYLWTCLVSEVENNQNDKGKNYFDLSMIQVYITVAVQR